MGGGSGQQARSVPSLKRIWRENQEKNIPKVSLLGGGALHGLVVGMEVRVIVNLERQRVERRGDLCRP